MTDHVTVVHLVYLRVSLFSRAVFALLINVNSFNEWFIVDLDPLIL